MAGGWLNTGREGHFFCEGRCRLDRIYKIHRIKFKGAGFAGALSPFMRVLVVSCQSCRLLCFGHLTRIAVAHRFTTFRSK